MELFTIIVSNLNLKTLTALPKRSILEAWLGTECTFAHGDNTVLKIQTEICKDERQVKMESF